MEYKFLILQHASLKVILDKKYDTLINVTIDNRFIALNLTRRHSKYAIVALTHSGTVLAKMDKQLSKTKREWNYSKCKIQQQKPSRNKFQQKWTSNFQKTKKKRRGLAQEIIKSTNRVTTLSDTVHETSLKKATKETGVLEHGEIIADIPNTNVQTLAIQDSQLTNSSFSDGSLIRRGRGRGRGRSPFYRNTSDNDSYDISIAPMNIFENQVIPKGLHNLSKKLGQIYSQVVFYH